MATITTTQAFDVNLDDGRTVAVKAGEQEVEQAVADHWFVKNHLIGAPKGRMPMVKGPEGLMIEADEAGQRVQAQRIYDPLQAPLRQEGPVEWSNGSPVAQQRAVAEAESTGSATTDAVDGKEADRVATKKRTGK